ncbi:MAG: DUF3375 domain-containing protein [Actinobacteria bacterium]|nr:DUF3375 domain-containing protein [Actinomycetota bacterium]
MDHDEIEQLAQRHGSWRLLRASNAPLILSFLGTHLLDENRGAVAQSELVSLLDDHLYAIHQSSPESYPRTPLEYLEAWASADDGWLRRFYPSRSEEVHYEATSTLEKAYRWVGDLRERAFVGTESRLHTLVALLREIVHGSDDDPQVRVAELTRRRDEIDTEIARIEAGESRALDATGVRDRYQQFSSMSRELMSDFREVEENLRRLDRTARERIAAWNGGKGELLEELVGGRADIESSEQGRSFQAFYDFLLSEQRQDELSALLSAVVDMPAVETDRRIRLLHHDWAEAAERTQVTVRMLSEQLRRFLDDRVWFENRRVLDLARAIEAAAIAVRHDPPTIGLEIDEPGIPITMPFERPLHEVRPETAVDSLLAPGDADPIDLDALLTQHHVDVDRLAGNIRAVVPKRSAALLSDVLELYPLTEGAAELIAYLGLDTQEDIEVQIDAERSMSVVAEGMDGTRRRLTIPHVTIART